MRVLLGLRNGQCPTLGEGAPSGATRALEGEQPLGVGSLWAAGLLWPFVPAPMVGLQGPRVRLGVG